MKLTIYIHGKLKAYMPSTITIDVDTPQQVISFLLRTFQGVRDALKRGSYRFSLTSDRHSALFSDDSRFNLPLNENVKAIHLVPVDGVYGKRFLGVVVGITLIAVGVALTVFAGPIGATIGGYLIGAGVGMTIGGIVSLFSPQAKMQDLGQGDEPANRQSTLFTNVTNRLARGVAIPVAYGRFYVGSNVISQTISTEEAL